ncbi:MAG: hypothetical protein LAP40_27640 [Acidobacteriia bacterium]|nr:hypothetical protein [Terriglobia bacterium]
MIPVALILLAATHVDLVDEVYRIPAGEWRYVELGLRQKPAFVSADFEVKSGSHEVRLALMRQDDLERLRDGKPSGALAMTESGGSAQLRYQVRVPGDYVVVIDNRAESDRPAEAHLHVALDFGARPGPDVTRLSTGRQIAVIAISFGLFFGIVSYSSRRLLRGIKR